MESANEDSYFDYICVIQMSIPEYDFVIDAIQLHNHIQEELGQIFETITITKLFHDAKNDVLSLQRDFSIFSVAVIDTQEL